MPGRDPAEATHAFVEVLQRAVSCICNAVFITSGYHERTEPHAVTLNRGEPVRLQGHLRLSFSATIHFSHLMVPGQPGPWQVSLAGYRYALEATDGRELISFHWHPRAPGEINSPHLHLGAAALIGQDALGKAHIPTGIVRLEDVLWLAIDEFAVLPRRIDWRDILAETRAAQGMLSVW